MNSLEKLAQESLSKRPYPKKEELLAFVEASLEQFGEISEMYSKFFESDEDGQALIANAHDSIVRISSEFAKIFPSGTDAGSIADSIVNKFEEVKEYHAELLGGDQLEGFTDDQSIRSKIAISYQKVSDFYNDLFGEGEDQKKASRIISFFEELTGAEGLEAETKRVAETMQEKHKELFLKNPTTEKSAVEELEEGIQKAASFKTFLEEELSPDIDATKKRMADLEEDIETKKGDVEALLSDATAKSLAQGFLESKSEYSNGICKKYPSFSSKKFGMYAQYVRTFLYNNVGRFIPTLINYLLFIAPLIAITLIFTNKELAKILLESVGTAKIISENKLEAVYAKTAISLPMLWIAWYGQRNISQRKRLREEYNHKYRVLQMYLHFLEGKRTYTLDPENRKALETILLSAIADNPARHLGKNETYIDNSRDSLLKFLPSFNTKNKDT